MATLAIILGDQLSPSLSSLQDLVPGQDAILMCEVLAEASYVRHHQKKIALIFAAMRHFAVQLRDNGYTVYYTEFDDPANTGSVRAELSRLLQHHQFDRLVITEPGEYRLLQDCQQWSELFPLPVSIKPDTRFLCSINEFNQWAQGRKQFRMEYFYRELRRKYQILMAGDQPEGGQWNYDAQNRKPPDANLTIPEPYQIQPDNITQAVLALVTAYFADHFGELYPFHYAVTREQALAVLQDFINHRLALFGDYQDAMLTDQPWMYHAHISFYLNCGLLLPLECIQAVEQAYYAQQVSLNAAEGFIRQILGWREYVRGIYWYTMPDYAKRNFFAANRPLPEFYWTGDTDMHCLKQSIQATRTHAYAHHIQRLMVLGNFALLAGLDPKQVNEWYLVVYADAYEWVELPNVSGMVLFADGGLLASKPYAAGGSYIHKMSDYCQHCRYKVKQKNGPDACPFNYLYWDFLARNRDKLSTNQRLAMIYRSYDRFSAEKKALITADAQRFLELLH